MKKELYKFSENESGYINKTLNLYICIDNSTSMDELVISEGKSRFDIMYESMKLLLLDISKLISNNSLLLDIGLTTMDGVEIIRRDVKSSDIPDLLNWIYIIYADHIKYGTPYNIPTGKAETYFLDVIHTLPAYQRKFLFISDGIPNPLSSASQAQSLYADMITNTGAFTTDSVDIHTIAIDCNDITYINLLDNTGGTETFDVSNASYLYDYLISIISETSGDNHYTSADQDETYNGDVYQKLALVRSTIQINQEVEKSNVKIEFPKNNEFARSWIDKSSFMDVNIFEKEGTEINNKWQGRIVSVELIKSKIKLIFESKYTYLSRMGLRRVFQRTCGHTLYRRGCNVFKNQPAYKKYLTITAIDNLTYTIDNSEVDDFFTFGSVEFQGVSCYVRSQKGNQFVMSKYSKEIQAEFNTNGSVSVEAYAGCDKKVDTCRLKFNNLENSGAFHLMPGKSPFKGKLI